MHRELQQDWVQHLDYKGGQDNPSTTVTDGMQLAAANP